MRRAILITIDGWGTNLVGTYGNSLCETPNLDRFAANSIVFDRVTSSSSKLEEVLKSIATGQHPCERPLEGQCELSEFLQTLGKQSVFMTDDPEVAELPWAQSFNETFCFDPSNDGPNTDEGEALDWTETRLAAFVETSLGELAKFGEQSNGLPEWTWLHLSGLSRTWDAPYEYRQQLCDDEDDPEPPHGTEPAQFRVDRQTDPDDVFGAACGAAAQGMIIDQIWSWIDTFLDEVVDREQCLVVLAGVRGYPLGEHQSVGFVSEDLYSELIQLPLIIQPGRMAIGTRDDSLVQPMSIWTSIANWLIAEPEKQTDLVEQVDRRRLSKILFTPHLSESPSKQPLPVACLVATSNTFALQVPRWSAVWLSKTDSELGESGLTTRLFLSPDDRWQQNDVTTRATEIADAMAETRDAWLKWLSEGCLEDRCPSIADCLRQPV